MTGNRVMSPVVAVEGGAGARTDLTAVSLFAGVGGIDLALKRSGVRVVAAVEIDKECRGVLRRQFPETKLFNDVTEVTGDQLLAAGFVPGRGILAGGSPCQDFSIAGRREGLGGARSGLFWHIMRLADELRPQWLVFENVPGLLSAVCSCPGNDTCTRAGRAVRCGRWEKRNGKRTWLDHVTHTPPGGACPRGCMPVHGGAMGTVLGAVGKRWDGVAYRILDAQHFGVPQRRERVFIVGCLGDRPAPVEILLEPESGPGDPASRGKARPDVAGTLGSRIGGSRTTDLDGHGAYVVPIQDGHFGDKQANGLGVGDESSPSYTLDTTGYQAVATLQGGGRRGHRIDAEGAAGGHLIPLDLAQITSGENRPNPQPGDPMGTLAATGQPAVAFALRADPGAGNAHNVSYALTARDAKGPDSDATSGFIMVPEVASESGSRHVPRLSPPLTAEGHDASEDGTGRQALIPVAATLTGGGHSEGVSEPGRRSEDDVNLVASPMAFNPQTGGSQPRIGYGETPTALSCTQATGVQTAAAVRRLTPLERERLQGFPDEWTRWKVTEDGREVEQSDAARDRQTGNAVAVPVVQWIAERLVAVASALPAADDLREAS